jgi:hypothetical protein
VIMFYLVARCLYLERLSYIGAVLLLAFEPVSSRLAARRVWVGVCLCQKSCVISRN